MLRAREYIYAVYQERNFSKAAAKLFISQPALSTTIKKTEDLLGQPIFNRNTNPISLTTAGEYYISCIEQVMSIERELAGYFHQQEGQHLTIGSSAFFCAHVLPEIVQSFQRDYPQYQVDLLESDANSLRKSLDDGSIDFMLEVEEMDDRSYHSRVLQQEQLLLLVPRSFAINNSLIDCRMTFEDVQNGVHLHTDTPSVSMYHFRDEPFLFLKQGNDCHKRGLKICHSAEFHPNVIMYLDQMLTAYYVAASGKGVAFVRSYIANFVEPTDKLYFYKINDALAMRNVYLHTRKKSNYTLAETDFKRFLRAHIH